MVRIISVQRRPVVNSKFQREAAEESFKNSATKWTSSCIDVDVGTVRKGIDCSLWATLLTKKGAGTKRRGTLEAGKREMKESRN